jgi:hypothetical protein
MKKHLLILVLAITSAVWLLGPAPLLAWDDTSFRCSGRIMEIGDSMRRVWRYCGEPDRPMGIGGDAVAGWRTSSGFRAASRGNASLSGGDGAAAVTGGRNFRGGYGTRGRSFEAYRNVSVWYYDMSGWEYAVYFYGDRIYRVESDQIN